MRVLNRIKACVGGAEGVEEGDPRAAEGPRVRSPSKGASADGRAVGAGEPVRSKVGMNEGVADEAERGCLDAIVGT